MEQEWSLYAFYFTHYDKIIPPMKYKRVLISNTVIFLKLLRDSSNNFISLSLFYSNIFYIH